MPLIKPVKGILPKFGDNCWCAENSTIVGDVTMGENCTVWFNAVIRGDVNSIVIGNMGQLFIVLIKKLKLPSEIMSQLLIMQLFMVVQLKIMFW
jgi:serine acetyltransferase